MDTIIKFSFLKIFIVFLVCATTNCSDNLVAEIPSYIEIESFNYSGNTNSIIPHPNTHHSVNITDAWVSMDGQIIGTFELPCKIPILNDGEHSFDIYPGIKVNGISGNRIKYPFYEKFQTDLIINRDITIEVSPETFYKADTEIIYENEGQFEQINNNENILQASSISDTIAIIQNEIVYQGNNSAAIYLDSINSYFDIRNNEELELNPNTFLELNFKSTIGFNIGLIIINNPGTEEKKELIQLYAAENWKKIYLELTPLIMMGNNLSKFKIYFEGNYDNTQIENAVYLDNIKLVFTE